MKNFTINTQSISTLKPTEEQEKIISYAREGRNIAIQAYAGAAKTSTLAMISNTDIQTSLLISFNKDIAEEAKTKFNPSVECRTGHSLAYGAIIGRNIKLKNKLKAGKLGSPEGFLYFYNILKIDSAEDRLNKYKYISYMKDIINKFLYSTYEVEDMKKLIKLYAEVNDIKSILDNIDKWEEIILAYWKELVNPDSDLSISHDVYLKLYQLSKPVLNYKRIYVDEWQDSNPAIVDIVLRQKAQIIVVGDPFQAIYEWRGAIDAFDLVPESFTFVSLSQSFRYSNLIGDAASRFLNLFSGKTVPDIKGIDEPKDDGKTAYLFRSNVSLVTEVVDKLDTYERDCVRIYYTAPITQVVSTLYHIQSIVYGSEPKYPVPELADIHTLYELEEKMEFDKELQAAYRLYMLMSKTGLTETINRLKNISTKTMQESSIIYSTLHKSKGLEFYTVHLMDDIPEDLEEVKKVFEENPQLVNLLYVGMTRAKSELFLQPNLMRYIRGNV